MRQQQQRGGRRVQQQQAAAAPPQQQQQRAAGDSNSGVVVVGNPDGISFLRLDLLPKPNVKLLPEGTEVTVKAVLRKPPERKAWKRAESAAATTGGSSSLIQERYMWLSTNRDLLYYMLAVSVVGGYEGKPFSWQEWVPLRSVVNGENGLEPDRFQIDGLMKLRLMIDAAFGLEAKEDTEGIRDLTNQRSFMNLIDNGKLPEFNVVIGHRQRGVVTTMEIKEWKPRTMVRNSN